MRTRRPVTSKERDMSLVPLQPYDAHNQRLESRVRPPQWVNPTPDGRYNLVVIGAGTAGR